MHIVDITMVSNNGEHFFNTYLHKEENATEFKDNQIIVQFGLLCT